MKESAKHAMIPETHPLRQLFRESVTRNFAAPGVEIRDNEMTGYISSMLCEFCDADQLFKIRNATGRPLSDVGEMLLESDPVYGEAPSFDRERQVRKHIGDYTLFFAGMFPESINHWRLRRQRLESFIDFIKAGKESYFIVSKFEFFEYAKVAPLFARLSKDFERCIYGLNMVKNEMQDAQHPLFRGANQMLM